MQTFVTIWWLKDPKIPNAFIYVGIQWAFVLLFVIIGFAVNSRPPSKYYSTPTPVCHCCMIYLSRSILTFYLTTVLVLDRSAFPSRRNCWRICLVLGDIACLYCL